MRVIEEIPQFPFVLLKVPIERIEMALLRLIGMTVSLGNYLTFLIGMTTG